MAAITYADHMLGMALEKLETLGVGNNTIVVFHSGLALFPCFYSLRVFFILILYMTDHGYQLGELNEWNKKTNTELATHVPFMIRVPWKNNSIGKQTLARAELVDLYRTLADLSGIGQSDVRCSLPLSCLSFVGLSRDVLISSSYSFLDVIQLFLFRLLDLFSYL